MTSRGLSWIDILFSPHPIRRSAAHQRTSYWTRNAGSLLSTGVYGRVMATMQPTLWQTAGCESLKNNSKDRANFQS
jgi:hypothetical protein